MGRRAHGSASEVPGSCGEAGANHGGEGLRDADPGGEADLFFAVHEALFASIDAEWGKDLLQPGELAGVARIDRAETRFPPGVSADLPAFIVAHRRAGNVVRRRQEGAVWSLFCGG